MNKYVFGDIYVGLSESFTVKITDKMMDSFRDITDDTNPLHTSDEFANKKGYGGKVAYGMLTASMLSKLAGVYLPGENSLIQQVDVKFVTPVYVGDALTVCGTVIEVNDTVEQIVVRVNVFNQVEKKILRGKMKVGFLHEKE